MLLWGCKTALPIQAEHQIIISQFLGNKILVWPWKVCNLARYAYADMQGRGIEDDGCSSAGRASSHAHGGTQRRSSPFSQVFTPILSIPLFLPLSCILPQRRAPQIYKQFALLNVLHSTSEFLWGSSWWTSWPKWQLVYCKGGLRHWHIWQVQGSSKDRIDDERTVTLTEPVNAKASTPPAADYVVPPTPLNPTTADSPPRTPRKQLSSASPQTPSTGPDCHAVSRTHLGWLYKLSN